MTMSKSEQQSAEYINKQNKYSFAGLLGLTAAFNGTDSCQLLGSSAACRAYHCSTTSVNMQQSASKNGHTPLGALNSNAKATCVIGCDLSDTAMSVLSVDNNGGQSHAHIT